ncbi:MAG TPA: PAS domain S-box protein [Candidatus Acetothermia bacterium]|nr:PAS domain S-box protein [Candidatus Acetothermia bacterium]
MSAACPPCPLAAHYGPIIALAVRLEHDGEVHGVLVTGMPTTFAAYPEEARLFGEIASDLAYALAMIRAREVREEAERRLVRLMGNLPGMAYRSRNDRARTMEFASDGCQELLGYEPQALVGNREVTYGDLIHPDGRDRAWDTIQQAIACGEPFTLTYRVRTATGGKKQLWERGIAVQGEDGAPILEGFIADITDRMRAEEALRADREQLRALFDSIEQVIYVTDPVTNEVLFVNRHLKELLRHDPVGGLCFREFQGRDAPCEFCTNEIILKDKEKPYVWEYHNPVLDRDYLITDRIIRWSDGRDVRFDLAVDITERKKAEKRQAQLLQRLTVPHRVAQEIVRAAWDPEQVYTTIHRAVAELMPAEAFVISLRQGEDEAEAMYLVDEGGRHPPEGLPPGEGMTWHVLSSGRAVFIPDVAQGIPFREHRFGDKKSVRSILAVPLRIGAEVVGMLSTQSYRPGRSPRRTCRSWRCSPPMRP